MSAELRSDSFIGRDVITTIKSGASRAQSSASTTTRVAPMGHAAAAGNFDQVGLEAVPACEGHRGEVDDGGSPGTRLPEGFSADLRQRPRQRDLELIGATGPHQHRAADRKFKLRFPWVR